MSGIRGPLGHRKKFAPVLRCPCPRCYADGTVIRVQTALGAVHFRCPNGHTWTAGLDAVNKHTRWVGVLGRVGFGKIRQGEA